MGVTGKDSLQDCVKVRDIFYTHHLAYEVPMAIVILSQPTGGQLCWRLAPFVYTLIWEDKPEDMSDKDWDKFNRQACGSIRLCLAKDQKYFVMRETKAKDLWKKLEDKFMTKSVENRLYSKKKLFRFQFRAGSSMNEHLSDFNKILADLQNLDANILDEDKALILLNSLPTSYDHLVTTLLYDKCAYCHNKGHWKRDCHVLRSKDSNSNYASDEDDDLKALVSLMPVSHSRESKWILDSDCGCHVCPNRDWFSSLKELDGGDVFVGDGGACKTLGIGTISLVMHDGFIWTLDNVRYVPSVKYNLISLGALETVGSVITLKSGALKVSFGNLVVMEGVRCNNLYFLEGSTVLGGAATGALDIGESVLDTTALGHECFDDLGKQSGVHFGEHYASEKQLGVKFDMAVDRFIGALDIV
ncbi:uncharacterized protein LOC131309434 [Rhododendron vialii]|uniref:uncharacterized protein LOC131309434 n=1 Tax=Rhododendron vialii TaxID=182163 RepID=UPI00265D9B3B|nr:uncharacterized protein LOC131309434 [Rhododendron vialii]